ncbi:hypothetical protein [Anianabacter salinae]|uniref:hypothetical protein n=1 Tax=Anianabacter salinae TaxID=2851023 RepID=UPI00225E16DF|nr:hypothetical protein [Anianabacter salinae]MBV0913488.1 hypothetical protein [Anianabacter salinae]
MRRLALALLLAGCGALPGGAPVQPETTGLFLAPGYLQPKSSPLRIDFDRAEEGVVPAVSRLLKSEPVSRTVQPDCGAGPVTALRWDGLTLNFLGPSLKGWVADTPRFETLEGLRVGFDRAEAEALGATGFRQTSLGTEFESGGVFGLIEDGKITTLWSGVTCFFR